MQKSHVPTSCQQTASAVVPCNINKLWPMIRSMKLSELAPKLISKSEFAPESRSGMINASVNVSYADGHSAIFRIVGINDCRHSINYEVVSAEPNMNVSSV